MSSILPPQPKNMYLRCTQTSAWSPLEQNTTEKLSIRFHRSLTFQSIPAITECYLCPACNTCHVRCISVSHWKLHVLFITAPPLSHRHVPLQKFNRDVHSIHERNMWRRPKGHCCSNKDLASSTQRSVIHVAFHDTPTTTPKYCKPHTSMPR
jgi:hypothetical protein